MSKVVEMLLAGALVAIVLALTYGVSNYFSRRRVTTDFKEPDEILTAAAIYVRYKRPAAAIELLEYGLETHPGHTELQEKLAELKRAS